jgi:hypothetical protein
VIKTTIITVEVITNTQQKIIIPPVVDVDECGRGIFEEERERWLVDDVAVLIIVKKSKISI